MPSNLPSEIIYNISKLVARDSTLDLKPFVLVNRQWHALAVPPLLATISVSSLSQVVELCNQIISSHQHGDNVASSCIAKYTGTLVISGIRWGPGLIDCRFGLEYSEDEDEDSEAEYYYWGTPAKPDIDAPLEDLLSMIQTAFSYFALLDGFEWYGRFAGDYCLVRHLQRANVIRRLVYGIEWSVSSSSPAYRNNAFLFTGLESIAITCELSNDELNACVFQIMRRNPGLQSIFFDPGDDELAMWRLLDLFCDSTSSSTDKPIVVWPNLQHLNLRLFKDSLWESAPEVDQLTRFLISHPKLETLFLHETCAPDCQFSASHPFSLAYDPGALPRLKKLLGSQRLIAGVLESRAVCLSVQTIMCTTSRGDGWIHTEQADWNAPYVERITRSLGKAPKNQIHRLTLEVPRLSHSLFATAARFAPNIRFLEFLQAEIGDWVISQHDDFNAATDIPAGLNQFPKLETISRDMAAAFVGSSDDKRGSLLDLGRQVPRLRSIHHRDGVLATYVRGVDGELDIQVGNNDLNNEDYDWWDHSVDWRHQPRSYRAMQQAWRSDTRMDELDLDRFLIP